MIKDEILIMDNLIINKNDFLISNSKFQNWNIVFKLTIDFLYPERIESLNSLKINFFMMDNKLVPIFDPK